MVKHFKIFGKNKKPEYVSPPESSNCKCPATMILHFKESFSDEQMRVYFCINPQCGKVFMCLPEQHANQIPDCREYIKKIAKELKLPKFPYAKST